MYSNILPSKLHRRSSSILMMLNFIMKCLNMNVYTNVYVLKGEKMFNFFSEASLAI